MKKKTLAVLIMSMVLCLNGCNSKEIMSETVVGGESIDTSENANKNATENPDTSHSANEKGGLDANPDMDASKSTAEGESTDIKQDNHEQTPVEQTPTEQTSGYLDIITEHHWDSYFDEVSHMYGHYDTLQLHTEGYPELAAAVMSYSDTHALQAQARLDELEEWAVEEYKEYGSEMFRGPYIAESDFFIQRADTQVLSIAEKGYSYEGGAHGMSYYTGISFDVQTGEEIQLEALIKDMNGLPEALAEEILEKYPDIDYYTNTLEEVFLQYVKPDSVDFQPKFTWTLGYEGVTFYFSDYEIGSYANGIQNVTLTYSEYPQLLEGSYFEAVEQNYVVQLLDAWIAADTDLNGDGVTDYISVCPNPYRNADYSESYDVTVNGNTFTQDTYCYNLDTFLVKANGRNYLYVQRTVENDYQSVCVFEITECSVEYMGEFDGGMNVFTNSASFGVTKRVDLLSTYHVAAECYVGEDGLPVEIRGIYENTSEIAITSTVDIEAELVDEEGNLKGEGYCFPAGTSFQFIRTDAETYVDMLADDGQWCRFYTEPGWPPMVNDRNAEECFEMLWYAG